MDEELKQYLDAQFARVDTRIDSLATAFAGNLTDLRTEFISRFDGLDRRIEGLDRRVDAMEKRVTHLGLQFSTFATSLNQLYNDHQQTLATQYAQQVAIDQLAARVKRLEDQGGYAK